MSLRARLLVTVSAVVVASLCAMALLSTRVTRVELERLEVEQEGRLIETELDALASAIEDEPGRASEIVTGWSGTLEALLLAADGRLLAASEPRLRTMEWRPREGGLSGADVAGDHAIRLLVPSRPVPAADELGSGDASGARLYVIPSPFGAERAGADARQASAVRFILLGLGVLGGLALFVTAGLARRIAGPLEELSRVLESADLSRRLAVRGGDEIARVASSFNQMADRLERAERLRRDLVSDVAHELRTPLTNLRAELEAVQDGLAVADAEQVASFHEEVLHLQRLVTDLEELAVAEAGGLRLDREPVDARKAAERALRAVGSGAAAGVLGGADVRVEIPDLPWVWADPRRLRQALVNLLENALRHTPADGRITIEGRLLDEGRVELAVADTGSGIPADRLGDVFERFVRLDPSRQRASGGAGLGLAIVRRWVEAHGGRVGVESEPGRGSRFWLTLPTVDSPDAARGATDRPG